MKKVATKLTLIRVILGRPTVNVLVVLQKAMNSGAIRTKIAGNIKKENVNMAIRDRCKTLVGHTRDT